MRLYKLTDQNWETFHGSCKWGYGITNHAKSGRPALCTDRVIHAYTDPHLAILLNTIHANISDPVLWEAEGVVVAEDGLKVGCKSLTTTKITDPPKISIEKRVEFSIRCALSVYKSKRFQNWAKSWLDGSDRSEDSAYAAAYAAAYDSAAYDAAGYAATYAAYDAAAYDAAGYAAAYAAAYDAAAYDAAVHAAVHADKDQFIVILNEMEIQDG